MLNVRAVSLTHYLEVLATVPRKFGRVPMGWSDATTPRTEKPVRFQPATRVPFGLCWGMVNKWAVQPSRIA
jgi:hypothetical protein